METATSQGRAVEPHAASKPDGLGLDALSITGVIGSIGANRRSVVAGALIGAILATVLAFVIPPYYDAYVQLMPPTMAGSSGASMLAAMAGGSNAAAAYASDMLGIKSNGAIFVGVLGSRTVADNIIQRFDLQKVYSAKLMRDARQRLASDSSFSEDRKSGIITIHVTARDPKLASDIANEYAEQLNAVLNSSNTTAAHRERVFLEERLKTVRLELDQAAQNLSEYSSKNKTLDPQDQGKAILQAEAQLKGQLIAAQTEVTALRQVYSDEMVRKSPAQARVNELQAQLDKLEGNHGITPTEGMPSIQKLPLVAVQYANLYRQAKIQETVFAALTQQYELAKVQEAKEVPSVRVLDSAVPPERKSGPSRRLIVFLGALVGLIVSVCYVSLRPVWNANRWAMARYVSALVGSKSSSAQ